VNQRDQNPDAGMVGKLLAVWLAILVVLALAAIDTSSIVIAHLHVSNLASDAAGQAASDFHDNHDVAHACAVAKSSVQGTDPSVHIKARGCKINTATGSVQLVVTKHASTLILGRLGFTKKYTTITETGVGAPSKL
jgi:uncharacterized membrane protein